MECRTNEKTEREEDIENDYEEREEKKKKISNTQIFTPLQ